MGTYRVQLNDGRTVRVEAASPQDADRAAGEYQRANPRAGERGKPGYAKTRDRLKSEAALSDKSPLKGIDDFQRRIAGSTGALDEVAGAMMFGRQGVENLFRRATGKPVEATAKEAAMAGMDNEREWQDQYAKANPGKNMFASGLGIAVSARPTGAGTLRNPFAAGAAAAVQNAPFAVARQQGNVRERLPGAAAETALAFGAGSTLTAAGNALGRRAAAARARPPTPARRLSQEGVQLTPGQMVGGALQRTEDAMTSVPVIGDAIRGARVRGIESFDRAAINRSLAPINIQLGPVGNVGRDGVRAAEQAISGAYDNALAGVTVAPDRQFAADVQSALYRRELPGDAQAEVDAVLGNIGGRYSGPTTGNAWKEIDAELRAAISAADNASAQRPSMRYARDTLQDVRTALQANLERVSPEAREAVRAADEATANLARIRQASQYTGTSARGGIFSPADLNRAVQGLDTSAGNRQFARGDALMQDLTDPAMEVLPQTVPDSGTPLRSLFTVGGIGGAAGQLNMVTPEGLAVAGGTMGAGAGLYSRPVQDLLNAVYRAKTPGQTREALGQLAQLAARDPALVPAYEQALRALGVQPPASSSQPSPQAGQR
jgi:hypothetical protein